MSGPVIELDDVTTVFRSGWWRWRRSVVAMSRISFQIAPGETLGLVGESGSGKTTTGAVVLGLQKPTSGSVLFLGEPATRAGRTGRMQTVSQNPFSALDPRMFVGRSIAEPLAALDGSSIDAHASRVAHMLEQVRLDPGIAGRYPHELSGGQRQRIAIARALIVSPELIVFDEAVSALDVSVQVQILNLIRDLQHANGFAALFISHDLAAVRYVADRIAVMRTGEVVELADTARFYESPQHEYSRQLLAAL